MFSFFVSSALAVVPPMSETEVADMTNLGFTAEVISVECFTAAEDESGITTERYMAELEIIELIQGELAEETVSASYYKYIYPSDEEMPSCASTGTHHPVGEIANYYFNTNESDENTEETIYALSENYYFVSEDSQPGEDPYCADIPVPSQEDDLDEADAEGESKPEATGCGGGGLALLFAAVALRKRKQ